MSCSEGLINEGETSAYQHMFRAITQHDRSISLDDNQDVLTGQDLTYGACHRHILSAWSSIFINAS